MRLVGSWAAMRAPACCLCRAPNKFRDGRGGLYLPRAVPVNHTAVQTFVAGRGPNGATERVHRPSPPGGQRACRSSVRPSAGRLCETASLCISLARRLKLPSSRVWAGAWWLRWSEQYSPDRTATPLPAREGRADCPARLFLQPLPRGIRISQPAIRSRFQSRSYRSTRVDTHTLI